MVLHKAWQGRGFTTVKGQITPLSRYLSLAILPRFVVAGCFRVDPGLNHDFRLL